MKRDMRFTVRIYTPGDPFHQRKSFFEKRKAGEMYLQIAVGNWAIMFAWVENLFGYMPFFMWVNHE